MHMVCLDLEGVLAPEMWVAIAEQTGVDALRRTTRDEPNHDLLMRERIALLRQHGLRLHHLQAIVAGMAPLPGAREFLDGLRPHYQVIVLSDTFYELAQPMVRQLGWPTLMCHRLIVDADGTVTDYRLRLRDAKRRAVQALQVLNFRVIAAGDSYNDTGMLDAADAGFLFQPPQAVASLHPQFGVHQDHAALRASIDAAAARLVG